MTLAEAILAITPQDVYDTLVTISDFTIVTPEDGSQCPLACYFEDEYPDEGRTYDELGLDTGQDFGVRIGFVRFGEDEYALPQWMDDYQNRMLKNIHVDTMGEAVALLEEMYEVR